MKLGELCTVAVQAVMQVYGQRRAGFEAGHEHLSGADKRAENIFNVIQYELRKTDSGKRLTALNGSAFDAAKRAELRDLLIRSAVESPEFEERLAAAVEDYAQRRGDGRPARSLWKSITAFQAVLLGLGLMLTVEGAVGWSIVSAIFGTGSAWLVFWIALEKATEVLVGVLLIGKFARVRARDSARQEHRHSHVQQVPLGAVRRLQLDAGVEGLVTGQQAEIFALSILRPVDVRQRVTETYTPNGSTVRQDVLIEVQLPLSILHRGLEADGLGKIGKIYFPILIAPKGTFQDNFEVFGADGVQVPRLTYREYLKLVACTLRSLLATGVRTQAVRRAELYALLDAAQRQRCDGAMHSGRSELGWQRLQKLASGSPESRRAGLLASAALARKLHGHYAVVVAVEPDENGRFIVKYQQTLIPAPTTRRKMAGLASALGARPVQLIVNLNNAASCQSYHAQAQSPDYLFLGRQELSASDESLMTVRPDAPTPVHMRFRRRFGQSFGHMYCRFFPGDPTELSEGRQATIRFTFYEVPPASVFRAAIASFSAFLLVWAVGVVMSRVPDAGTDAPAILLAFPAVAAALVGFDKPQRSLLDSTLAARVSLMLTATLSVAASALFMVYKVLSRNDDPVAGKTPAYDGYDWPHFPPGFSLIGVTSVFWSILTFVALLNACATFWVCISRYAYYAYLGSRNTEEPDRVKDR
ncbi:hypothetical protein [Amycolatopsis japonica]